MVSDISPMIVAIDDGYHSCKVVTRDRQTCLPTAVTRASRLTARAMSGPSVSNERCYEIEGSVYTVGADVLDPIHTRFAEFPYSAANLAVAMDALRRVLAPGAAAHVVTDVPFNWFYAANGQKRNSDLARKISAWGRSVRELSGVVLPRIVSVDVVPEAVAAWFDFVIGRDLQLDSQRYAEYTAVVDIGGRTTDVAVVKDCEVDLRQSGTLDVGTLELAGVVRRVVEDQFPGTPGRSCTFVESAIHNGVVRIGGREIDIRGSLERTKSDLLDRIADYLAGLYGRSMHDIRHVLFVGGGSALLETPLRRRFQRAEFADEPQMANARGLWKFKAYSAVQRQERPAESLSLARDETRLAGSHSATIG